jgi:hypothetical protein
MSYWLFVRFDITRPSFSELQLSKNKTQARAEERTRRDREREWDNVQPARLLLPVAPSRSRPDAGDPVIPAGGLRRVAAAAPQIAAAAVA